MTLREFRTVRNKDIFKTKYDGTLLLIPSVVDNTQFAIIRLMDSLQDFLALQNGGRVVIHALWESAGHVTNSKHYTGIACDFHIAGEDFLSAYELVKRYLDDANMSDSVGWGIYPDWNNPGFHIDVRGKRGRWGYYDSKMTTFDDALAYSRKKFKRD